MKRHMKHLCFLLVAVLVHWVCLCANVNDDIADGAREVAVDSADATVVEVVDHLNDPLQHESLWSKVQSDLGEQQFGLHNFIDDHTERSSSVSDLWPIGWIGLLDDNWFDMFLIECDHDLVFKAGITQNLSSIQAFVAFVSIGYAIVAMWLGPMKLTYWQQRSVLVTYTTAVVVQAIFLAHVFNFIDIHLAYPSTLALAVVFFVAFNITNALLVLESEAAVEGPVQQIIQASSTRVVTAQRAVCY